MSAPHVQVQGLCRWSYPADPGAFNLPNESFESMRAALYAPERLETRLFFLEHVVLPCLKGQTDGDFTLNLMLGETLPDPYRSRLLTLISEVPQVRAVFLPEGLPHKEACRDVMLETRDESADVVAEFRLDDDDAVATDFVDQLRALFKVLAPVYAHSRRCAVDFSRGYILRCEEDGAVRYDGVQARLWTPALALYLPPSHRKSLINYPHMRTWRSMPVLSLSKKAMFLRGAHGGNDSAVSLRKLSTMPVQMDKLPALLAQNFNIDASALEAAWARLCD